MDRILLSHLVITLCVLHLGWAQKCPYNWYGYSQTSKCFRFVRSTKLTWQDARDYCQTHGGDLLKLESAGERNWVTRQVQDIAKRYSVSSSKWWTGLNNREYLTRWTWADGSPAGNFIPWSPGEPNNARNEERCAEIMSGNKFNDQACSDQDFFICNRPRGLPLACDTDNQWQTLNGQCYKVYTEKQSWTGAQSQCSQDGGSMVVIESAAVESTVHDFASLAKQPMWIGLHSVQVGEGNTWGWSNGPLLTTSTYWHDGTPHVANSQLNSSCVSVSNSLPVSGDWDSESCSTAKAFVCQKPEGVCFNGWVGHSANCYQFDPQFRLPYTAAASFCSKQGAQLLKIDSQTDQLFIRSYLDEFRDSDATTIWLGLSDNNKDTGPYVWRDGKELDSYQYWAYRGNKPINNKGKMDCGYIASTDRYGKWRVTTSCQASRAVICRIPMGMPVKPMPPTPRPRYGCPPNWQLHVDTCFLVGDAPYDQFTARTKCQQYPGADLAVIDSADMQGFVNNLIQTSQNYYIGLNDKSAEGVFVWNDGSDTVSYTNWRPKEPNDYHHQESCVVIYGGAWNDISCNAKAQYICSLAASEVIHPTPAPTPATDWTVKCGMGWESNPVAEYCYMFSDQPLIWTDALLQCRNNKGNLAYITTLEEQSYMAGRVKQMSSVAVWIGANDRRTENGWAWSSGRGFAYFNWAPGQPDSRTGKASDCVAMLTKTAEWDDLACNKRNGFVCKKKGSVPHTRAPKVTTTALPAGKAWGCGQYWKQWRKSCYAFVNRKSSPVTWPFADIHCRRSGARLVSITSRAEQNFVVSNLPSTNNILDRFWIGMTDIQIENRFLWSDGNDVAYTNWNVGEPNSWKNTNEDCVDIYLRNGKKSAGKWNDQACDRQMQGYICKRPLYIVPASQTANPQFAGCPRGTRGYGPYCYRFYTTTLKTWDDANATCTSAKGELATISDKFVQAFVSSRLVNYNGNAWVGLTDRAQPGVYAWASGHAVSYTAWDRNHTGNERSTCVAMRGSPIKGLWSNQDCGTANGFVCQLPRKGYTVPPTPPTPYPNVPCPMGWTENYAYCLKIFSVTSQKKNWMDAWAFCQALGGDLPSFHEGGNDTVVQTMTGGKFDVWIGLNDRDTEAGHKWSDGSAVDYTNWNPNEPNDWGKDEDCVVLTAGGSWNDLNCFNVNSFLCALPRGTSPMTTLAPPVPVQSAQCGPGWIYYNNNCYLLSVTTGENRTLNWYDAQSFCRSRSATLASFHTQQENNLITSVVQTLSSDEIWVGLYLSGNTAFGWTDGSPMDFKFWKVDEPNNYLGGEKCGGMSKWSGKWNDQLCTEKNAYVCKKPLGGVANIIPSPNSPGGCPSGFTRVTGGRNKCFYIVNSVRTNWTDAYAYCRKLGKNVDLASIEDVYEQQFVLTMPTNNGSSLWIGLSDRRGSNRFYWLDNSPVVFTSWDRYQPTSRRVQGKNDTSDCVVTRSSKGHEGRWADRPCSLTKFFLCQTKQDPNIPIGAPPGAGSCRQGYRAYRSGCYRLSNNVLKWADAEGTCQKDGGHLASINDAFEEAFVITIAASAAPYWIGLSDTKTPGLYYWSDGSRMVYAKWGRREPSYGRQGGGHGCVLSDPQGRWNDTDCSQPIHYVCKISTATVPPTNPSSAGSCANPTWTAVGDYCYYVNVNTGRSWPEANFACQQRGMQLASVHSQKEFQAVVQMVGAAPVKNDQFKPNIWLGMSKDENGAYLWSDGTATNYLSWATGQPSALGPNGTLAECVEFDRTASTWNTAACLLARGFVCKASKVYSTAPIQTVAIGPDGQPIIQPLSQTGDSGSSSGLSGGGVAGIILGLLLGGLLVTFIILYLKRTGKILNNSGGATPSVSVQAGFDNSAYSTEKQESDI